MARDEESGSSSSEEEERVEAESSEGEASSGEEEEAASESGSGSGSEAEEESGDEEEGEGEDDGEAMELDENGERHYNPPANFKRFEADKVWIDAKELNPQHHELWLVRMPKTLNAEALKGLKLELPASSMTQQQRPASSGASGVTGLKEVVRLQQGKKNYSVVVSGEEYRSLNVIVPTRSSSTSSLKFLDANLPLSRQLNIIEAIDVPEITLEETISTSSSSTSSSKIPPPPDNMKVTYLPIGAVGLDFDWRAAKRKGSSTSSEAKSPKKKKLTNETSSTPSSSKSKTITKAPSTPLTPATKDKKGSGASISTPSSSSTSTFATPKKKTKKAEADGEGKKKKRKKEE